MKLELTPHILENTETSRFKEIRRKNWMKEDSGVNWLYISYQLDALIIIYS